MLISIITINYNDKEGLGSTISSVINQNFENFEYIVIDGNSTDGSKEIIEANKKYFSSWVSEDDTGIYNAMNKGIKIAKGKYLLFLNSGDTLYDNLVLSDVALYLKEDDDIYYGDLQLMFENRNTIKTFPDKLNFSFFSNRGYLPHPATFIKRTLFNSVHLYNEDFKIVADWDFLVCAIFKHNAAYKHIKRVVSVFDKNGISSNPRFYLAIQEEKEQSLKNNFSLFFEDSERLVEYDKKFNLKRFKMLNALEVNPRAQKINSIWLGLMSKLFKKRF
ncbi:glycosyltransferase family 2 protein [Psychroserpens sp.]